MRYRTHMDRMTTKKDKMISRANTDERSVFMLSFLNLLLVILNLLVRFVVLFSELVTKYSVI